MPEAARTAGCPDIARQLVEFSEGDGPEVVLGGGRESFLPESARDPEYAGWSGKRRDGRDLISEWLQRHKDGRYVWNLEQFQAIDTAATPRVLGLFNPSAMQFEADRGSDEAGEPSLHDMTRMAINLLRRHESGYFLMIEGALIDHAHHYGNAYRALTDTQELARAVAVAREMTDPADTLIIVTADHSHGFTMGGYAVRGNPILGKVVELDDHGRPEPAPSLAKDGKPYTTLGYYDGPGYRMDAAGRRDLSAVDTTAPDFLQDAAVPLEHESHSGEDVPVYAAGPWAQLVSGVHEQNYLYHVMYYAAGLPARTRVHP